MSETLGGSDKNSRVFDCAPVLLIGFNRPDYIAAQIEALRSVRPNKVYMAIDGPRDCKPSESELCRQVRECAALVDWPCDVKTLFRDKNLGCKYGVSEAITWFFANEPEGIILEDDCRPTSDFLRFASEMLESYKDDKRIGAVCGFNFFNLQTDKKFSYHFSRHMDVWGWASWRRVWKDYDVDVTNDCNRLFTLIDNIKATKYYKKFYKSLAHGVANGLSTWDVQMSMLFIEKGYLSVVPKVRLVANVGLADDRATHTGGYIYWNREWSRPGSIAFPLTVPDAVCCDDAADNLRERIEGALLPRGLTWLGSKCPWMRGALSTIGKTMEKLVPSLFRW